MPKKQNEPVNFNDFLSEVKIYLEKIDSEMTKKCPLLEPTILITNTDEDEEVYCFKQVKS